MPIGNYPDFGTCTRAQRRKGKSKQSADKICGKLEQIARKANR
jgi:hypothetical protein